MFYFKEDGECDFIARKGSKISEAFQVCFKLDDFNREREVGGLVSALKKFNLKSGLILTYDQEDELIFEGRRIIIKPVWKWL